jgi:predicted amidohydrolase
VACLDPEQNIRHATSLFQKARLHPGDIVVMPELWPTSYGTKTELRHLIIEKGPLWSAFLEDAAKTFGVYLVGGTVPALVDDALVNRLVIYSPLGDQTAFYDKMHLFPPLHEEELFAAGALANTFPLEASPFIVGPVVCYDLRFPELFRLLATKGANLFVLPAEFPDPKEDLWHTFISARAAENQAFVIACNRTGELEPFTFFGSSAIYDPEGRCVGRMGRESGYLSVPLDASLIEQTRRRLRVLEHTRIVSTPPR